MSVTLNLMDFPGLGEAFPDAQARIQDWALDLVFSYDLFEDVQTIHIAYSGHTPTQRFTLVILGKWNWHEVDPTWENITPFDVKLEFSDEN